MKCPIILQIWVKFIFTTNQSINDIGIKKKMAGFEKNQWLVHPAYGERGSQSISQPELSYIKYFRIENPWLRIFSN